jgi:AraC-like DNA-binding protein
VKPKVFDLRHYMWGDSAFQVIRMERGDLHRHGALQLTLGIEGEVRMGQTADRAQAVIGRALLVAAHVPHWFQCDGWAAVSWMEPESRIGRLLAERFGTGGDVVALPAEPLEDVWSELAGLTEQSASAAEALRVKRRVESAWFGDAARARPIPPALKRALTHIRGLEVLKVSAAELAEVAGVSESHLLHLFGEELGVPLRRYLLWLRMKRAVMAISDGANATQAAHTAGFYDSAHLTKSFKELLSLDPSQLVKLREHIVVTDELEDEL